MWCQFEREREKSIDTKFDLKELDWKGERKRERERGIIEKK